ncbi:MAG: aspartate kinase [Bacteroidales bacterium]|nr:aspartate kinase [Bacteroidales bacterium]
MKVYKFGGASVKDAAGVSNLYEIVSSLNDRPLVVVVSAMGETTNALAKVLHLAKDAKMQETYQALELVFEMHRRICYGLFRQNHAIFERLAAIEAEMKFVVEQIPGLPYNQAYDSLVGYGELISTYIVSAYFQAKGLKHQWLDARQYIITDSSWRMAMVNMEETRSRISKLGMNKNDIVLTQGFIGSNNEGHMTTLGREGSDYSAALFAWALGALSLTLWKDVPGVMSADPAVYSDAEVFSFVPYREAVELTYYGASVIHPKTIKPLENAGIPLLVKSFKEPMLPGTLIAAGDTTVPAVPSRIRKTNQVLITLKPNDLSFVSESMMAAVLQEFHTTGIRIHLMQNSALSLSVCIDYDPVRVEPLLHSLSQRFRLEYNSGLTLLTIRHYLHQPDILAKVTKHRKILLEQRSRSTAQYVFGE